MIRLVLAMVRARLGQAVTLALLSLFAVASAVAAPAYLRAADRAVAAGQIDTSVPGERGLLLTKTEPDHRNDQSADPFAPPPPDISFAATGTVLVDLPGFDYVYAAEYPTVGIEHDNHYRTRLVYRQNACAHLSMVRGRCLIGESDVVLGERTARRLNIAVGAPITLTFARFNPVPQIRMYLPEGAPKQLIVVGTYRVPDPADTYWGPHDYFGPDSGNRPGEPAFVNDATLLAMDHGETQLTIDGYAGPGALDVDRLPALRAGLAELNANVAEVDPTIVVQSQLPGLLDRIDAGRDAAHLIVPVLAVPLVLLACLSIFLAVGYGSEGRRPELAVVALRGARRRQRWWLGIGESIVAITAGAVAGCVAGQLLVNVVTALRYPGVGADPGVGSLRYAPAAALGAVLAALLAERRQLFSPVAELLRRTPGHRSAARAVAVEVAIALLAVVAGAQLAVSHGTLTGVGTFATAMIVLALALLIARALLPALTRYAARALRRGRIGLALAGFQLSRRDGAGRLFALLVAAVAVAGYAVCAADVAARARDVQADLGTGAARVLSVQRLGRQELLTAVRAADPQGRYAMAVVRLQTPQGEPPGLAVDTTRLGAVANWPDGGPGAAAVARALRPAAPAPVVIAGADLSLDITASGFREGREVSLGAVVSSVTGLGDAVVRLGLVQNGRHTYEQRVGVCRTGCRVNAVELSREDGAPDIYGRLVIRRVGSVNPVRDAVPAGQLADPARWRVTGPGQLAGAAEGLRLDVRAPAGLPRGLFVQPVDTPYPIPIATAGPERGGTITGLDGRAVPVNRVVSVPAIPGAGGRATMVDLEYADRVSTDGSPSSRPQVWLSAAAPTDIVARLTGHGLVIVADDRARLVHRQLDHQGPAVALWFYLLAGCLAVVLAAGSLILAATVDRPRRVEDLSALREQGLTRGALQQATVWTYPVLVAVAAVAGVVTALVGWGLTGWALPLAGLEPPDLPLPAWPRALPVAVASVVVMIVLGGVAYATGRRTLRELP